MAFNEAFKGAQVSPGPHTITHKACKYIQDRAPFYFGLTRFWPCRCMPSDAT